MMSANKLPQGEAIHMTSLYAKDSVIGKLWRWFLQIFSEETEPTEEHLFELVLSVFALDGFQSVKFNFEHFIGEISAFGLKSFYYALNEGKIALSDWMENLMKAALSLVSESTDALILSVDDTLTEKFGEKFEHWGKLYDHAAHNGSHYLNGHCFVSLMLSVPVRTARQYLSFPIAYRMWTKAQSKLEMAAELVRSAMAVLGTVRQVILCCDSWYPKSCVKRLIDRYANLVMICSVRIDTALYDLPPEKTGKRGRPRARGKRLSLKDFTLKEVIGGEYLAGCRKVKTMLFGSRVVWAIVTKSKKGNHYRLYLCTKDPKELRFDLSRAGEKAALFAKADADFLPLTVYALRWNIEVSYYEQKTFWALGDYRLRSQVGMERLVNLLTLCYAAAKLIPYSSGDFSALRGLSPQQVRFTLGRLIRQEVFLAALARRPEIGKNAFASLDCLKSVAFASLMAS